MNLKEFIEKQHDMDAKEIIQSAYDIFTPEIIATSSFGASSGVIIHLMASMKLPVKIVYVNTGFLFRETLDYIEQLKDVYLGIEFVELKPKLDKKAFLKKYGPEIHVVDSDFCCRVNKVEPLNNYLYLNKIKAWITGLRKQQTETRRELFPVSQALNGIYKISPIFNWTSKEVYYFMENNGIPFHPLYKKGYTSIGCEPCTGLPEGGDERSGRWKGKGKKECGLHTEI